MSEGLKAVDARSGRPEGSSRPRVVTTIDTSESLSSEAHARVPVNEPVPADIPHQRSTPAATSSPARAADPDERGRMRLIAGKVIPGTRYRLLRWLGEGGMGVVYEAEHVEIERRVALKILRLDLSKNPEMVQTFRDEARAASRTGHPNIVEIYDFGELPDGRFFLCMELLVGHDLVPASDSSVLPPAEVLSILRQLCKGLGAAHKAGVIHRDVKPENILVVRKNGRDGVVKILDFGISTMFAGHLESATDKIAGTPHYMAPEQIRGDPFDGRLDQYALGCVAYELLTGRPPFPGQGLDEVLCAHVDTPPPSFAALRPDLSLPHPLEQVIQRCLAKQPDDRYPTMADLEAALCEAQIAAGLRTSWDDLPLPDLPPDKLERLRSRMPSPLPAPRTRWFWPALALFFFALAALTTFLLSQRHDDPSAHARSLIDSLAEEALLAASRTFYVAPPPDQPDAPTAFIKVVELEALEGPSQPLARARAHDLRQQFAAGLVALGDKYWDVEGAHYFAAEYYTWARAFDPDNLRAAERSGMTPGAFDRFQVKTRNSSWSPGELQALGLVSALADDDETRRQQRSTLALGALADLPISQHLDLDAGLRGAGIKVPSRTRPKAPPEPPPTQPPPPEPPPPEPELEPEPEPDDKPNKRPPIRSKRDPARAKQLADEGASALKAGRRTDAENLFHQAIYFDNRNAKALMGLSDVYFDTGAKLKAVNFAELAVEAAPQSKNYHLKLGDAYFVVLRYRDALKHYEKARDLGDDSAQGRIDKVKKLIGP